MMQIKLFLIPALLLLTSPPPTTPARIVCEFSSYALTRINTYTPTYVCSILNPYIFNGTQLTIDSVSGSHLLGYNDTSRVTALHLGDTGRVGYVPKGLGTLFRIIALVNLFEAGLVDVHQADFWQFPSLTYLDLSGNFLTHIDENLFTFNPRLTYLYLQHNRISQIGYYSFTELYSLSILDLNENVCEFLRAESRAVVTQYVNLIKNGSCIDRSSQNVGENLQAQIENLKRENRELKVKNDELVRVNEELTVRLAATEGKFQEILGFIAELKSQSQSYCKIINLNGPAGDDVKNAAMV
jgi:hypothetical protein